MRTEKDRIAIDNERLKAMGTACNGLALGMIGFAFLRPAIELGGKVEVASAAWFIIGLAFWGAQFYILGQIKKEVGDESA